ncbi:LysR family transcriptional regulator [Bordetella genomosp. 7]|uniref:LysR family transcriptional regulator n=2 Tax=Bordetella TaxID=517 RepID=UPI0011402839|nr:LysR substrate-binding domain-containing protein [Bordetella genomosp. 7]
MLAPIQMDLKQLRQFVVLSETLNISLAAQKLFLGQPALSVSLRKLEEEWGCQLFERTPRGMRLTMAGSAALEDARRALMHAHQARDKARLVATGQAGTLKLGFIGSAMSTILPRLLAWFCLRHPQIRLEPLEHTNSIIVERVKSGDIDIGVVRLPIGDHPDLSIAHLQDDWLEVVMPRNHPLASRQQVTLCEVAGYPFIQYTGEVHGGLSHIIEGLFQAEGHMPNVTHKAVQVQSVVGLVDAGLGLGIVPNSLASRLPDSLVLRPLAGDHAPKTSLGLIMPATSSTPACELFYTAAMDWKTSTLQVR